MTQSADQKYTLAFTGDVMLGRGVNEMTLSRGTTYPLGDVVPLLKEPDLTLINLECVISKRGSEWMNPPHAFYFRADPVAVEILKGAGIDYVTLANNHVLDYGYDALEDTFQILEKADIQWAGAGRNLKQAKEPAWLKTGNLTLAVLAATDNFPEYAASQSHSGTWYFEIPPPETFFEELKKKIAELRKEGADLIVYSTHWGPNMVKVPPQHFQEFAHRLIDLGVDIFHGHSAHVFQGIEIYKGKIIFYDTGNFVDDYWVSEAIDEQFLYLVHVEGKHLKGIELIPVKISEYQVNVADTVTGERTLDRMRERSEPFRTKIQEKDGRGHIKI